MSRGDDIIARNFAFHTREFGSAEQPLLGSAFVIASAEMRIARLWPPRPLARQRKAISVQSQPHTLSTMSGVASSGSLDVQQRDYEVIMATGPSRVEERRRLLNPPRNFLSSASLDATRLRVCACVCVNGLAARR